MFNKLSTFTKNKKLATGSIILILAGGYFSWRHFHQNSAPVQYVLAAVERGTIVSSVSGTGQVSATNEVEIKPQVAGNVLSVNVIAGAEVKTGDLIAQLNPKDASKSVRDAQVNLESAQISLEKVKQGSSALAISQAESALKTAQDAVTKLKLSQTTGYQEAQETKAKADDNLRKAYEDGFSSAASIFLELPDTLDGIKDMLFDSDLSSDGGGQWNIDWYKNQVSSGSQQRANNYRDNVYTVYYAAKDQYDSNFSLYQRVTIRSDAADLSAFTNEVEKTVRALADAVKLTDNYFDFVEADIEDYSKSVPSAVTTQQNILDDYNSDLSSDLASFLSTDRAIKTAQDAITAAQRAITKLDQNNPIEMAAAQQTVKDKEASLADLKSGPDELELRSTELALRQRQNALADAQEKYADYSVRAPFDGVVATLDMKKGDAVGSSAAIATLVTKQKIADISLNEVDVANVRPGQKVTLTFDAFPDLERTGQVASVDSVGTASQGVVFYNVKVAFDIDDDNIKSGMSASATIITDVRQDVLTIPSSALKTQGDINYVQVPAGNEDVSVDSASVVLKNSPAAQTVETGLSNDTAIEILSGLNEGDKIVLRTIDNTATTAGPSQNSPSLFGMPGAGGSTRGSAGTSAVGGVRIMR